MKFALQLADVETEESEGMKVLRRIMKRVWFPRITADINTEKEKICDKISKYGCSIVLLYFHNLYIHVYSFHAEYCQCGLYWRYWHSTGRLEKVRSLLQ